VTLYKNKISESEGINNKTIQREIVVIPDSDKRYRVQTVDFSFISGPGKEIETKSFDNLQYYTFNNTKGISVIKNESNIHEIYKNDMKMEVLFPGSTESDYELYKYALEATPKQLKFNKSMVKIQRINLLLMLKSTIPASTKIYIFKTEKIKGFIYINEYKTDPAFYRIELFDNDNKYEYTIVPKNLTEDEINLIISSFKFNEIVK